MIIQKDYEVGGARCANSAESMLRSKFPAGRSRTKNLTAVRCENGCKQHVDGSLHLLPPTETDVEISHG